MPRIPGVGEVEKEIEGYKRERGRQGVGGSKRKVGLMREST